MYGVKLSERGVMQFVPTDFEVPFGAVEGIGGEVVEPFDRLHEGHTRIHLWLKPNRIHSRDLLPTFMETYFVQKDHGEILNGVWLDVPLLHGIASQDGYNPND